MSSNGCVAMICRGARSQEQHKSNTRATQEQHPTGEYKLSQTQAAEAIGKDEANVRDFLVSKSLEALPYKDFTAEK